MKKKLLLAAAAFTLSMGSISSASAMEAANAFEYLEGSYSFPGGINCQSIQIQGPPDYQNEALGVVSIGESHVVLTPDTKTAVTQTQLYFERFYSAQNEYDGLSIISMFSTVRTRVELIFGTQGLTDIRISKVVIDPIGRENSLFEHECSR